MTRPERGDPSQATGSSAAWSSGRALILVYHRVADVPSDPWGLAVTPPHFAAHMEALRRTMRPLSLLDLVRAVGENTVPPRGVVVTFDDGYADNLFDARPALERWDIPATVFIATGYTGDTREFWWDALQRALLNPGRLPRRLEVTIDGKECAWEIDNATGYDEHAASRHQLWRAWQPPPTSRHSAYIALWRLLRPLPDEERKCLLDEITGWAGIGAGAGAPHADDRARPMSAQELSRMAAGHLVEMGAHTVTHPLLASLAPDVQRQEIANSRSRLEGILARSVSSLAYPYGSFDDQTVEIARDAGFACACAASPGYIDRTSDWFRLPRVPIQDCPAPALIEQLTAILEG